MIERASGRHHQPGLGVREAAADSPHSLLRVQDGGHRAHRYPRFEVGPYGVSIPSPDRWRGNECAPQLPVEAERTSTTYDEARDAFVNRSALGRMITEDEVGEAVVAMLGMPGMSGADVDLSAGMVA